MAWTIQSDGESWGRVIRGHPTSCSVVQGLFATTIQRGLNVSMIGWCVSSGFVVESVADGQKYVFKQQPGNADQFINTGLWHYSRHPNCTSHLNPKISRMIGHVS